MTREILWSAAEAAEATGGRNTAGWSATGVSIDSRTLNAGDLFVAIKGPHFDGHDYIADAFAKGAAAAVSHRPPEQIKAKGPLHVVDDTMAALWRLGAAARGRSQARFVGVTGSVGKTGTKEAIATCLAAQAPVAASAGSFNNQWGLPLSLMRMSRSAAYGVFEIGMNHPGEIRELTRLLRPNVALITNVEAVHIGYFKSVEEIADAKAEIFEGMSDEGTAVLNRDNPHFARLSAKAREAGLRRIISFGKHAEAMVHLTGATLEPNRSEVSAEVFGTPITYTVALPGAHWVINSLAVLATITALGADVPGAAAQLAHLSALKGRGQRHNVSLPGGGFLLIDDAYNASPTSMRAAFDVLGRAETGNSGRRIAVLGDMLELGAQATSAHVGLAQPLRAAGIDLAFTCGPGMAHLHDALPKNMRGGHAPDSRALVPLIEASVRPGDAVMVKGSLGSRMALVVEALLGLGRPARRRANGI
jgi:UDP-N-acetylmuramoyl-tripeptide--D-alanyl-D-alanine ligase